MDVIRISAIAIAPLFVFMMLGYYFKKKNYLSPSSTKQINILVFRYFLSIMCAETIYKANLREDVELLPVLVVAIGIIGIFLISWLIIPRFVKDKTQIPVMIQGIYKSNYAILGIPIAQSICGADNIGIVSVIAVILVPLNNCISAFIFEKYTGNATSVPKLLLNIIKNPLVVGSLLGLLLNVTGVKIPSWIMTGIVAKLSALATPLSMIALGASFEFSQIGKYKTMLTWAVIAKLLIVPGIIIPVAILLGIRSVALVGVMIYAAAPNAVNSYSTAVAMGGDADLANEIVVMTSLLSMLTMFGWFVLIGLTVGF
ncbi:MAG: AEC family transporter [Spirochaetales bacterium]|nr:AEC family transporter [Spirochaetales bacterium]